MTPPQQLAYIPFARRLRLHVRPLALALLVGAAWIWLYRALGDYLGVIAAREDFRTNQLVLLGVVALIVLQVRAGRMPLTFSAWPQWRLVPLLMALGGSAAYLIAERWLDMNTLSATLAGLATYGLIGLWLEPRDWRAGFPAALLLIGVLPFGEHLQTFIGYPLRIATAQLVRDGLAALNVTSTGVDTILILENGVSQIDLPCSGIKSLWTGMLFLLAATWLERRRLDVRWGLVALGFFALLFLANVMRVAALVVAAQALGLPILAGMIHVPLGVLGFAGACAVAALWLRRGRGGRTDMTGEERASGPPATMPGWLSVGLVVLLAAMGALYMQRPATGLTTPPPVWSWPDGLAMQEAPLKPDEVAWLTRDGAESATRYRFAWQGITGSLIVVPSRTWRAHHNPERCFQVYGLTLDSSRAQLVTADFPLRAVVLRDPKTDARLAAAYWFQSASRVTDDFGTRMWADTTAPGERWVLVSLLFDGAPDPNDGRVTALYRGLHATVAAQLAE